MALTEAQRRAHQKWDNKNMTTVGCKLTKEKARVFREACAAAGEKPNKIFLSVVDEYIAKYVSGEEREHTIK